MTQCYSKEEAVGENELFIVEVTSSETKLCLKVSSYLSHVVCGVFILPFSIVSVNTETIPQKQQRRNRRQDEGYVRTLYKHGK